MDFSFFFYFTFHLFIINTLLLITITYTLFFILFFSFITLLSTALALVSSEFWDYEEQVDLEAFSSSTFYEILLKHSVSVTVRLGQLKGEVRLDGNKYQRFKYQFKHVFIHIELLRCN